MVVQAEWFKDWFNSPYYHQLYFENNNQEAAVFISIMLDKLKPAPGAFLLDVGCGRAKHTLQLAAKGFDVTGIDLSFDSIEEAKKYESDKLHFFQHDMRLPFWINYFDYAFSLFTSFGYFRSEREHYNGIRTISHGLKDNGYLVLDYLNTHYEEDHLVHKAEKQVGDVGFYITKWYDETHFFKKIMIEDEQLQEPLVYQEKLAKFSLGDFTDMFAFHQLQIQEVYGDYQLHPYDIKKSPRLIMIAKKLSR
jgi:SAM-dependent methyltransferase